MAKSKADLHKEAVNSGAIAADSDPDDFTAAELEARVSGDIPVAERVSATKPIIAPDGHVVLSQEDIDNRMADFARMTRQVPVTFTIGIGSENVQRDVRPGGHDPLSAVADAGTVGLRGRDGRGHHAVGDHHGVGRGVGRASVPAHGGSHRAAVRERACRLCLGGLVMRLFLRTRRETPQAIPHLLRCQALRRRRRTTRMGKRVRPLRRPPL